jgi:hypothetical protein
VQQPGRAVEDELRHEDDRDRIRIGGDAAQVAEERVAEVAERRLLDLERDLHAALVPHMDEEDEDARAVLPRAQAVAETYGVDVTTCVAHARRRRGDRRAGAADGAELLVVGAACSGRRVRGTIRDVLRKAPCRVALIAVP